MKTLVTGGAGFIGSSLVECQIQDGNQVSIVDNRTTVKIENLNKDAEFFNLDISDVGALKPVFKSKDSVFHTAAIYKVLWV